MGKLALSQPKNVREVRVVNCCLNCKYNIIDDINSFRFCERSGQSEWGEPENMVDCVCDGHSRTERLDR